MGVYVGVDLGTTAVKVIVYNPLTKEIEMDIGKAYQPFSTGPGMFEQNPSDIEDAVFDALKQVAQSFKNIDAIVLDSALHTLLLLDKDLEPIGNIVPWLDERSVEQVRKISNNQELANHLHRKTGCPPDTVYPFYKILWLYENDGEKLEQTFKIVSQKDYIVYKLAGELVSDISVASGSGCLDIHKKQWCYDELKDLAKLEREKFPQLVSVREILRLQKPAADRSGLKEGIPVIVSLSDAAASSIGAGAGVEDSLTLSVGSSAAIRTIVKQPPKEYPAPGIWCYILDENHYITGAAIKNGGYVFDWYIKLLSKYDHTAAVKNVEKILYELDLENSVLFYPFIFGKRFPKFDPTPCARFDRLKSTTTQEQVAKSVLEGIAFNLKRAFDVVKTMPKSLEKVVATGGLTQADVWMKMVSAIFDQKIILQSSRQGAALGTVLYVLSNGDLSSLEQTTENIDEYKPEPVLKEYYAKLYQIWLNGIR
ncbi:gluconokinase [Thermotoga profunda]|uniref:gluconokinase n=1 Tax=Thermotoga profunda TaxID=1508420 RepID=UPI000596E54A|nr:gluconokinase [Thermotoga profunda]